jgi:uncharacterized membrane protein YccC
VEKRRDVRGRNRHAQFPDVLFVASLTLSGITLPPIIFIEYLNLNGGHSTFRLAWERFVDIVIGIAAAVIIGTWLWPIHARVQYFYAVADTMDQITEYCEWKRVGLSLTSADLRMSRYATCYSSSLTAATSSAPDSYTMPVASSTALSPPRSAYVSFPDPHLRSH